MKSSKASLFLMELVIVILFFALSSAVCIQLFVKAHTLDRETVNMNHSVVWIQNLSESFLSFEGNMRQVKELYKDRDTSVAPQSLVLLFDRDWNAAASPDAAAFTVTMLAGDIPDDPAGGYLLGADITIEASNSDQPLFTQHIDHYVPRKGAVLHDN